MKTIDTSIFKAYDIRGVVGEQITPLVAYLIGRAYMQIIQPKDGVVGVGRDVREHGGQLKEALMQGLQEEGAHIVDLGMISTDMLYFGVGHYGLGGGITVTASHNPAEYNGMKMVREGALPISGDTGIEEIRDRVVELFESGITSIPELEGVLSSNSKEEVLVEDYTEMLATFVDMTTLQSMSPIKIAFNANHGLAGEVITKMIQRYELPVEAVGLYMNPDGSFPQGRPDPMYQDNQTAFKSVICDSGAAFGCAWDADADRCFFFDEEGEFVDGYYVTAILAEMMLKKNPGGTVIYDPRLTWAVIDTVKERGGTSVVNRVGHSFIKARMRKEEAVFAGENSGHYYFKEYFNADNGIIPFLLILEKLVQEQTTLKEIAQRYRDTYFISGEINTKVADPDAIIAAVREKYADGRVEEIDGFSVEYDAWRCNIRKSNTEPLLRLNLEARSQALMEEKRDEVLKLITG
jgi:phosphomannomutase